MERPPRAPSVTITCTTLSEHRSMIRLASTGAIRQAPEVVHMAYHAVGVTAIFQYHPIERRS